MSVNKIILVGRLGKDPEVIVSTGSWGDDVLDRF